MENQRIEGFIIDMQWTLEQMYAHGTVDAH